MEAAQAHSALTIVSFRSLLPLKLRPNDLTSPETCDSGFKTCGQSSCFCFADYLGAGFCGENAVCAGRQTCNDNKDCDIGSICATKTCCPAGDKPGICLIGTCSNPGAKLIRMAAMLRREQYIGGDTAAWSAYWG